VTRAEAERLAVRFEEQRSRLNAVAYRLLGSTADDTAVSLGAETETRGADVVATFMGRARGAVRAIVDGAPGAVWMVHGRPRIVFSFTFADERIAAIGLIGDEDRLRELELTILKKEQSDRREAREWKQG
jgi:hypothetical protein